MGGGALGMSEALRRRIDGKWEEVMRPRGFATYDDFRAAVNEVNTRY